MNKFDTLTKEERHIALSLTHNDTEAEKIFKLLLDKNNIEYKSEVIIGKFRADFIIQNSIYEINGGYHNKRDQRKRDRTRAVYLLKRGYEITEITNKEVFDCQKGLIKFEDLIKKDERCIDDKFLSKSLPTIDTVRTQKPTPRHQCHLQNRLLEKTEMSKKYNENWRSQQKEAYKRKKEYLKAKTHI